MLVMSQKLKDAIDNTPKKKYEIARSAGLDHSVLSKLCHDVLKLTKGDKRVLRLGQLYGIEREECFDVFTPESFLSRIVPMSSGLDNLKGGDL